MRDVKPAIVAVLVGVGSAPAAPSLAQQAPAPAPNRATVVADAIHRSGAVPRCWNAYVRAEPNASSVQLRLRVDVASTGAVQRVVVLDPAPEALTRCVRAQVARVAVAAGEAVSVEATYHFAAGVPAPVPGNS